MPRLIPMRRWQPRSFTTFLRLQLKRAALPFTLWRLRQIISLRVGLVTSTGLFHSVKTPKMRTIPTKAVPAVIAAALSILLATASFAQDDPRQEPAQVQPPADARSPTQPQTSDPPALVARIGYTQGDVSFMAAGSSDWSAGVNNYPMVSGDRLFCDKAAQAEIGTGTTDVRLWQNTDVTLTNLTNQFEQIGLATGSIRVRVYSINPGATVEIDTPNGAAVINQPGDYRFDVVGVNGGGDVSSDAVVNSGTIQITGPNGLNQQVIAGQAVQMTGTNPIQLTSLNLPTFDALDQWSIDRDHEVLNSAAAQYVNPETPGASDLDANGSWTPTPDYGPVWTPTTVAPGWTPYSVGSWAYVSPWGYTWIDAAPWGYAPFHYGRWVLYNGRWGWVPGPRPMAPVYSPALVAWVGGPRVTVGVGVSAWFPLGVGEPYVPWYHASPYYTRQVNVTNVNVTYIHNTAVVNNYNNFIANTRTVNNVNQINTSNIQYANRAQVVAVPQSAMASGRPVTQSAVSMTPALRQRLTAAPVHYAPSAPAPQQSLLAKANVRAPAASPTLVTSHGLAKATPAENPATLAPANLSAPRPASSLPQPVAGAVAGRPATAQPAEARLAPSPASSEYRSHPYSSATYGQSAPHQQAASNPTRPPKPKPQKTPKPPKEEKQKR